MKVSMEELRGAIRLMIAEEIKKILPALVSEALSEKLLKVMVETAALKQQAAPRPKAGHVHKTAKPTNLRELMQGDHEEDWEEETPKPMPNDHKGIYHQSPLVRGKGGPTNEQRRRMLADVYGEDPEQALRDPREAAAEAHARAVQRAAGGDPSLAMMFEGTRPVLPEQTAGSANLGETQQIYGEEGVPLDMLGNIGVNFGNMKRNMEGEVPPAAREQIDEARLKQLEAQRKALDRRV